MTIVVIALVGRQLLGDRVGLIAGVLAALYPGLWSNDAYLQSETLTQLLCALALLFAYQALRRPSTRTAGLLGVICGAAALTRGETILLLPLLVVPALLLAPGSWKRRGSLVAVATVVMSLVIAPWAIYNSTRLHRPEPISSLLGPLLLGSNCPATYYGPGIGGFGFLCAIPPPKNPRLVDVSDVDYRGRRLAVTFVRDHASRLPVVVAARVGRTFGFFHPLASHEGDVRRERPLALVMLLMYYALAVAGVAGAVVLRRAGRPIWPLVSLLALSLVVTVTSYGNVRFRAAGDAGLVVLAAVAAAHGYDRIAHRARDGEQPPVIA
jgi:4-amino-4-deoxy-L-arabinose transferase-like glycosyltransferase